MTKLIVGKNSSLVKILSVKLKGFHYISHLDVESINFSLYTEIYIFSYSKISVEENIILINKIIHKNIFYISTVAVFSIGLSGEYYKYPKNKIELESYCLTKGIKIIRIGSFEGAAYYRETIAVTTLEMIGDYFASRDKKDIKNLFYIEHYQKNISGLIYRQLFRTLSHKKYTAIIFAIISKLSKKKLYGYSYAANLCFNVHIQIGYGALGSRSKIDDTIHIVVSDQNNIKFTKNGFNGLLVGKTKQGLGKLWHGVYTTATKENNKFIKKNILYRNKLNKLSNLKMEIYSVDSIENDGDFWILSSRINKHKLIADKLTLAAGPFENLRLLSCLDTINVRLNDDEVFFAGSINIDEPSLVELLFINNIYIRQRYLLHVEMQEGYLLIDFRPFIYNHKNILDQSFYNNSVIQIIYKLITKFNVFRINEAIYNLFGFGIKTKKLSVYCQYSKINSISLTAKSGYISQLSKKRASPQELDEIYALLSSLFSSFNKTIKGLDTIDGQHISGGKEILSNKNISKYINNKTLKIIGIPSNKFNDALHTTVRLFPNEYKQ